jgi:hypothetical protein
MNDAAGERLLAAGAERIVRDWKEGREMLSVI